MDAKVAKRYALALFRTAQASDMVAAVETDLDAIQGVIDNSPRFAGFLTTPRISREEKAAIVEKLFGDSVTALTARMLRLLLQKRRESEFEAIRKEYSQLRRDHGAVLFAKVTSATELTSAQRKAIVDKLAKQSGKEVEAEYEIDPKVIGGVKVQFGNFVVDGTVRGSLNRLRDTLKYQLLKQS